MKLKLIAVADSDTGKIYEHNEDSVFAYSRPENKGDILALLIVADGIGGHKAGEVASQLAIKIIHGEFEQYIEDDSAISSPLQMETFLQNAIQKANSAIYDYAKEYPIEADNLGCTLTCTIIRGDVSVIANVGDSRTYHLRNKELQQVTDDHSLVAEMVKKGIVAPEDVFTHPYRSVITRALGNENEVEVDVKIRLLEKGDRLLLCSDGLWEMLKSDEKISKYLQSGNPLETIAKDLIQDANDNGGADNISVVIAEILEA